MSFDGELTEKSISRTVNIFAFPFPHCNTQHLSFHSPTPTKSIIITAIFFNIITIFFKIRTIIG
jgi:hypothetical protein